MIVESFRNKNVDKYPKLMIANTGKIVLFSKRDTGVVVQSCDNSDDKVGYYCAHWVMECFEDFKGVVKIISE